MTTHWQALAKEVGQNGLALYNASPTVMKAFSQLVSAATADGALSKKIKEMMAVSISVVTGCQGCIAYHTQAAVKAGATREEFIEALNVAVEMGGGPAFVYGAAAHEAYEQFMKAEFSSEKVG